MAGETLSPWLDIDEEARRRLKASWAQGSPVAIEEVLPAPGDPLRSATLEELVCVELELVWRHRPPGPRVEDYLRRFPELDRPEVVERLRDEEEAVVKRFGGRTHRRGEVVGRGGMGVVWRASDPVLGRDVALKELHEAGRRDPELRRRFLAEARVTAQLEHPGVVPVYQLEEEGEAPFYTMRLVQGQALAEAMQGASTPLQRRRLLEAFLAVARTLSYAHARGVVHRDVKPDNIVVGAWGETVVLDWGLARARPMQGAPSSGSPVATQAGTVMGTPAYMSPEAAGGQGADPLSDQYSLGAVLYQLLVGHPPFSGGGSEAVLQAVRQGPPPAPRALDPAVPPELDAICGRAMDRDPAQRYPDVAALAEDVERYLAGEPTEAWPEPWTRRVGRWVRRHRTLVVAAAVALLVAGVAGSLGLVARERAEQQEARRVAMLQQSLRSAREQARIDLEAGRYGEARDRLDAALAVVEGEPWSADDALSLRTVADDLAAFGEQAHQADELAFLGLEGEAVTQSEQALGRLGVLQRTDWWLDLPGGLPPERVDELQWEAFHQLQLLASLVAVDHCDHARALATHAGAFRPSQVLERAMACEPRDPCLSDGSGSYWDELEQARCTGLPPKRVEEGLGYALRARAGLLAGVERREASGDLQAAVELAPDLAEVHWLAAEGLEGVDILGGNEAARAYGRALELEMADVRPRSEAALVRLRARLERAAAHATRPLAPEDRAWLEADAIALQEVVRQAREHAFPERAPVPPPTRLPPPGPPHTLAVLNGGFELGLSRHWGRGQYEQERPIWWTSLTARSEAEIVEDEVHGGRRALHILHHSAAEPHVYGTTTQAVPARAGTRYRLIMWTRLAEGHEGSLYVPLNASWSFSPRVGGTTEWTRMEREFTADDDVVHLRLVADMPVEMWVDDISIERLLAEGP